MKNIFLLFTLSIFLFMLLGCKTISKPLSINGTNLSSTNCFSYCKDLNPIGGGIGYNDIYTSGQLNITLLNSNGVPKTPIQLGNELVNEVTVATSGAVIYLEPNCHVELSSTLVISKEITIASNRGHLGSLGASITLTDGIDSPMFQIISNNVRITGLRLVGHKDYSYGLEIYNVSNIIIDNNECYNWMDVMRISEHHPVTNINEQFILSESTFYIHNNHIHHNTYKDSGGARGYGIMVWNSFVQIYANQFEYNRHDIAGVGSPHSGFNLFCNIFGNPGMQVSNIDMHGDHGNSEDYAGGFMHIHHNEFTSPNPQANIFPVGKPTTLMLIDNNKFASSSIYWNRSASIQQTVCCGKSNTSSAYGNIVAVNNIYANSYLGWYVTEKWTPGSKGNFLRIPSSNDLLHSNIAADLNNDNWIKKDHQILDYQFGDFDGDGYTDIFKSDNGQWYMIPLNTDYANSWIPLATSGYSIGSINQVPGTDHYKYNPNLVLSNFNADNKTDVFVATGIEWRISSSATGPWNTVATSSYTPNNSLFGNFYKQNFNDLISDVFRTSNDQWYISYDESNWIPTATSDYDLAQMKIGDFNNDGYSDIFHTTRSFWHYSSNASSNWINLATSDLHENNLIIGDFNLDGISDVIGMHTNNWWVSLGGVSSWKDLSTLNFSLTNFKYGNMN